MLKDLQYAGRMIARQPGYAFVVVLTLALAIGANSVIFSFANVLLLRPLPIREPGRVAFVWWLNPERATTRGALSIADLLDARESLTTVQPLAGMTTGSLTLTGRGDATRLSAMRVTANLLSTWGVGTTTGRAFLDGEDAPGAQPVAVLSHQYWTRVFGSDPSIVGQALVLNGRPHTVVGVLEPDIEIGNLSTIDVWTPVILDPSRPRDDRMLRASGRIKPGATLEQVDAEIKALAARLEAEHRQTNAGWSARAVSTRTAMGGQNTWMVMALLGVVVGLVLVIACANLANLVLVRTTARRREIAIRTALGAARVRLVGQLVTEHLILGLAGGACGLLVAEASLRFIRSTSIEPFFKLVEIDRNVMVFGAALSLLTPVLFSLLPAVQSSRADVNSALNDATRGSTGVRGNRSRAALVVAQLTLAVMLLVVAGLLVQTMIASVRAPLGFQPDGVLTMQIEAPEWKYRNDAEVGRFWETLLTRLSGVAGVRSVAATTRLPVIDAAGTATIDIEGRAAERDTDRPWAVSAAVTPDYFTASGIPIRAGRAFSDRDAADALPVAIVSQEAANRYWRNPAGAIGSRVAIREDGTALSWRQVVGIAADVQREDLQGSDPQVYLPLAQTSSRAVTVLLKSEAPSSIAGAARNAVRDVDSDIAVYRLRTFDEAFEQERTTTAVLVGLFVAIAVLALALAATGLYGVMSYAVSQRSQEIGIRMALGAIPRDISRMVAGQSLALVAAGVALGAAGGAGLAQLTRGLLYGVSPLDPLTFGGVTGLMLLVAAVACAVPMRRAMRVDTVQVLRGD